MQDIREGLSKKRVKKVEKVEKMPSVAGSSSMELELLQINVDLVCQNLELVAQQHLMIQMLEQAQQQAVWRYEGASGSGDRVGEGGEG